MSLEIHEECGGGSSRSDTQNLTPTLGSGIQARHWHNGTDLHLAAREGDGEALRRALDEAATDPTRKGGESAAAAAEAGETPLIAAAEKGHLEVVVELLRHLDAQGLAAKNRAGYDALHVAARQGHHAVVQEMLVHNRMLAITYGPANTTPLISAAMWGHAEVVKLLLELDHSGLVKMAKDNGKTAIHFAARQGHTEIVKALLEKDPLLARRTDKKGQTALHMAAKGTNCDVLRAIVDVDPAVCMLPDRDGRTVLHIATKERRVEIVIGLLQLPDVNVNALTREHITAYDIAEGMPLSERSTEIKIILSQHGAVGFMELDKPRVQKTAVAIAHTQLEQMSTTDKDNNRCLNLGVICWSCPKTIES
uniref:Uncharacterized protein n=1 Tax=Avena sativa TaxID=4498 RepID=A0ACD5YAS1_AVESA